MPDLATLTSLQGNLTALETEVGNLLNNINFDKKMRWMRGRSGQEISGLSVLLARTAERYTYVLQGYQITFVGNPSAPIADTVISTQLAGEDFYQGMERVLAGMQALLGQITTLAGEVAAQIAVLGG